MITAEDAKTLALALGFDRAGIAPALPGAHAGFLRDWLARGYDGEMEWIGRRAGERMDPREVMPGARSLLVVGLVYDPAGPDLTGPVSAGRIARYAGGEDYHELMLERLEALGSALEARAGGPVSQRAYVDTGPVHEREAAAGAGLGWIGKNTCLIDPELGSYLFLGVLLTDLELAADAPIEDHCGSCRACLDACPTDAFPEPYVLDASRCLSYTTIEVRGEIPEVLRAGQGDWVFGCDVCQEVCPWNTRTRRRVPADSGGLRARLAPRAAWRAPSLEWLLSLGEEAWRAAAADTALRRTKRRGLLRNALVAAGNSGDRSLGPAVRRHAEGDDPLLAEHARWALRRLELATSG
ncbi:MAG: tRNA epoxyqueuosine(34) reductase QueG [Deltaproteobacteria bacterium]|nr:tRNA epoxyqueuosine(34) reductase QueG [Deltaproteobacteria bacterium]MBW2444669.1 tRNA epoxyqueuosine(34) reductase QueG [Deltaproteobacteria bacterium]